MSSPQSSPVPGTTPTPAFTALDYTKFFAAGALCCTLTHGAMTPVDVVKTRIQLEPAMGKLGMVGTARSIVASEGAKGLLTGFGATAVGYLVQGGAKFAGFELAKKTLVDQCGGLEKAQPYRTAIHVGGAAIAEFFADVLLTPLEATRIRLVSDRTYASGLASGFLKMARTGGVSELYAGFIPILAKQIPYAVGQFAVNEACHEAVNKVYSPEQQAQFGPARKVGVTLGCGVVAGVAAAVLSHPADTLLSKINQGKGGKGSAAAKLVVLAKEAGPVGLFAGLGPRIVMTVGLVSGQFLLYDIIKSALSAPPGINIQKD